MSNLTLAFTGCPDIYVIVLLLVWVTNIPRDYVYHPKLSFISSFTCFVTQKIVSTLSFHSLKIKHSHGTVMWKNWIIIRKWQKLRHTTLRLYTYYMLIEHKGHDEQFVRKDLWKLSWRQRQLQDFRCLQSRIIWHRHSVV